MTTNSALAILRAQQELNHAEDALKQSQQNAENERLDAAFKPIIDFWNSIKHLSVEHYRAHSRCPLATHQKDSFGSDGSRSLHFWNHSGNTGIGYRAEKTTSGNIEIQRTFNHRDPKTLTCDEAIAEISKYVLNFDPDLTETPTTATN